MNRRSAMLMAVGLVLTLIVGGVAISLGLTGPTSSAATPRVGEQIKKQKPIVLTVRDTVTIHKKGTAAPAVIRSSGTSTVAGTTGRDDSSEESSSTDDGYEGSEHEEGDEQDHENEDAGHEEEDHEEDNGSDEDED